MKYHVAMDPNLAHVHVHTLRKCKLYCSQAINKRALVSSMYYNGTCNYLWTSNYAVLIEVCGYCVLNQLVATWSTVPILLSATVI